MVQLTQVLAAAILATGVVAHPGDDLNEEIVKRQAHLDHPNCRSIQTCKRNLVETGWVREEHQRREKRLQELREAAGSAREYEFVRRDAGEVEANYGAKAACTLDPESIAGPYLTNNLRHPPAGELIRKDLLSGEKGVTLHLDLNLIDVSNCQPIPNAYVDLWGANATGVYSGVKKWGNGDASDNFADPNSLRGIQPTNDKGTASFITMFPGYYYKRTNHLHTIIHHGATLLENNTITGGGISHVGQLFFDQDLINQVIKIPLYKNDRWQVTPNDQDRFVPYAKQGGDDPFIHISLIGKTIEDGLYGTMDIGVNPSARQTPVPAVRWTENGGVPVPPPEKKNP